MDLKQQFCGFRNATQPHYSKISEEFLLPQGNSILLKCKNNKAYASLGFPIARDNGQNSILLF